MSEGGGGWLEAEAREIEEGVGGWRRGSDGENTRVCKKEGVHAWIEMESRVYIYHSQACKHALRTNQMQPIIFGASFLQSQVSINNQSSSSLRLFFHVP